MMAGNQMHNNVQIDANSNVPEQRDNRQTKKKSNMVKGQWTPEEDSMLIELVGQYGIKKWAHIARMLDGRIGKQCRERWHNHLRPNIKMDSWSEEEDRILIQAHAELGNKWVEIARRLPGRTENSIKNHWNTNKRRQSSRRTFRKSKEANQSNLLQNYIRSLNLNQIPATAADVAESSSSHNNNNDDRPHLMIEPYYNIAPAAEGMQLQTSTVATTAVQGGGSTDEDQFLRSWDFGDAPELLLDSQVVSDRDDVVGCIFDQLGGSSSAAEQLWESTAEMPWYGDPQLAMPSEVAKKDMDLLEMISAFTKTINDRE